MLKRIQACSCLLTFSRLTNSMFSSSILGWSDLLRTMALNTVGPIVHTLTWRHLSLWLYEHRWDNLCPFVALIHLYAKVTHPAKNLHQRFGFLLLIYGKVHTYRLSTKCWRWVNDKTIVFNDISTTFHLRYNPGNKTTIIAEISAFHSTLLPCRCGTLCSEPPNPVGYTAIFVGNVIHWCVQVAVLAVGWTHAWRAVPRHTHRHERE